MNGKTTKCLNHRSTMKDAVYITKIHRDVLCKDGKKRDRVQVLLDPSCGRARYKAAKKAADCAAGRC